MDGGDFQRWRSPPPQARPSARGGWARTDWTPLVLVVTTLSLCAVAVVWLAERSASRSSDLGLPGDTLLERAAPNEVALWVARRGDGVTLVLSGVWSDAEPDVAHDLSLSEGLHLEGTPPLAWYTLLLFNLSPEARLVPLGDGALELEDGAGRARLTSLAERLARAGQELPRALHTVLGGLGALSGEVSLPPGDATRVLVCFERRVDLSGALAVRARDGTTFSARRMTRRDYQRLLARPDEAQVSTL